MLNFLPIIFVFEKEKSYGFYITKESQTALHTTPKTRGCIYERINVFIYLFVIQWNICMEKSSLDILYKNSFCVPTYTGKLYTTWVSINIFPL